MRTFSCPANSSFANANSCSSLAKPVFSLAYSAAPAARADSTCFLGYIKLLGRRLAQPVITVMMAAVARPTGFFTCGSASHDEASLSPHRLISHTLTLLQGECRC